MSISALIAGLREMAMIKLLTTVEEGILVFVNIFYTFGISVSQLSFFTCTPEESREDLLLTDLPIDYIRKGKRNVVQCL